MPAKLPQQKTVWVLPAIPRSRIARLDWEMLLLRTPLSQPHLAKASATLSSQSTEAARHIDDKVVSTSENASFIPYLPYDTYRARTTVASGTPTGADVHLVSIPT